MDLKKGIYGEFQTKFQRESFVNDIRDQIRQDLPRWDCHAG